MHQDYDVKSNKFFVPVVLCSYCLALIVFFGCLILQALGILEMSHRSLATLAGVIVSMIGLLKAIVETTGNKKR